MKLSHTSKFDFNLSKSLMKKIKKALETGRYPKYYWDQNSSVSVQSVYKALETNSEYPIGYIIEDISDNNSNYSYDLEQKYIAQIVNDFQDEIIKEIQKNNPEYQENEFDAKEIAYELRDDVIDTFYVDMNIKQLLNDDVPVRIEMYSNYDYINSHWFESQTPLTMDSYFGDVVRILQLNPAEVKEFMLKKGMQVSGAWNNQLKKNPYVTLDALWREMINRSTPANLLTFIGVIDQYELLNNGLKSIVEIPKGNNVSFYSEMHGGGSIFEMELLRPMVIDLTKSYDASGFLRFNLRIDCFQNKYSIVDAYGVGTSFFGASISIKKAPVKKQNKIAL